MIYAGTIVEICNKKTYVFTMGLEMVTIKTKKEYFLGQQISFRKKDLYRDWYFSYPTMGVAAVAVLLALALIFTTLENRFFQSQNAGKIPTATQESTLDVDILEKEEAAPDIEEKEEIKPVEETEEITKDLEEIEEPEEPAVETFSPSLSVTAKDQSIVFDWTQLPANSVSYNGTQYTGFQFYKVVASETNSKPKYPEDGYLAYITDKTDSDWTVLPANKDYHLSPKLESGKTYYFSITYVFENGTFSSNAQSVQVPVYTEVVEEKKTEPVTNSETLTDAHISVAAEGASLKFGWTPVTGSSITYNGTTYSNFQFYKVVASATNAAPKYPDDGYLTYITDYNQAAWTLTPSTDYYNQSPTLVSGTTYYFSITYVFENGKLYSDTVTCLVP